MTTSAKKCQHCGKFFLDADNTNCPYCKKPLLDPFIDNPFKDIFNPIFDKKE